MRAFFCLPVVPSVRTALAAASEAIERKLDGRTSVSWVRPANYHVTVRFLGEIDPMGTVALEQAARDAAGTVSTFTLPFDRVSCFPSIERPRVLWIGGDAPKTFRELCVRLNRRLQALDYPADRIDDLAHVTLARFKTVRSGEVGNAIRQIGAPALSCRIDRLVLMESRLTPSGAVYAPLFEVPLTSEDQRHAV